MSARSPRVEVMPHGERRRSWSDEQKREMVLESLGLDVTPTAVARRHGVSTGQVYTWRRQMLAGQFGPMPELASFAQVEVAPELHALAAPQSPRPETGLVDAARQPVSAMEAASLVRPQGLIEIVLPGGTCVRVDAQVDVRALRRVLGALEGR